VPVRSPGLLQVRDDDVGLDADRPLDERTPIYEAVARFAVETDGRTPEQVADDIEEKLGR